jgi:RimJ/RimL family protein N-acetyltransferase
MTQHTRGRAGGDVSASRSVPQANLLKALKRAAAGDGPVLSLPVGRPVAALLRPVAPAGSPRHEADVKLITEWRNLYPRCFMTEFMATCERTARWLAEQVVPDDRRILFLLDQLDGRALGHMGIVADWEGGFGEADAILRGRNGLPGVMSEALTTLMTWARDGLGLERIGLRVRSDNPQALRFYEKRGLVETRRIPLRCCQETDRLCWVEDPEGAADDGIYSIHMTWPGRPGSTERKS